MYKFYQEQPENSWACHPIRGGKDVDEKKNSGSNSTETNGMRLVWEPKKMSCSRGKTRNSNLQVQYPR